MFREENKENMITAASLSAKACELPYTGEPIPGHDQITHSLRVTTRAKCSVLSCSLSP